jgi:hypothetical protein
MRLAYKTPDGVAIVHAAAKRDLERALGPLTERQYREHVISRSVPTGVVYAVLPADWTPPGDRTYRGAWDLAGGVVALDMPKARGIFMERVRKARNAMLDDLDREWMKAQGQGKAQEAKQVDDERQALRDLPQTIKVDEAFTVEALTALWPF